MMCYLHIYKIKYALSILEYKICPYSDKTGLSILNDNFQLQNQVVLTVSERTT